MKKKIKDLTLDQVDNWDCTKQKNCLTCPLFDDTKDMGERCLSVIISNAIFKYQKCLEKETEVNE